ncbi:TonB-dependent receptor SusC [Chryseobacterium aquaeductus]|uniref:TonB-dependent receptor SusC n=1 Tax=Chryseobacterium aquaeductus TaxID=2675056 RepID=A0A9N8QTR6_9FLAO|nr:SusC/RagA family TonB-linked outer membrane protein [Chryseobacterium aquaeductus]CAA7332324.1 TonB-dependent receptor SusC [Chryseobacterium potabilaquae]CAD7815828.1 TonB-dependent receptor SusC [Chryseobacterium aquaeductus]
MNLKLSRSLGAIAVLYFTASFQAQKKTTDSIPKEQKIEEVVMIGYGGVKKQNLTSAVSTIKSDAFDNRPIYSVAQALQGNAAGVNVVQPSGKPGAGLEVKIRGNNSLSSMVSPLYVVDGIQTTDISGINPDDIVDMNILKDATSTAIYGVNGSGGVVIITTKRGKFNKNQLSFNAYWGMSKKVNNVDVLNLEQYKTLLKEINVSNFNTANDSKYSGIDTDWEKEVYQTGFDQNYNVGYSFGNEKVKAYTSMGYQNIQGIINPSQFDRYSFKVNLDADLLPWLKLNTSLNYFNTKLANTSDNLSTARGGVVLSALVTPRFLPVYGSEVKVLPIDPAVLANGYLPGQFTPNPFQSSWENPVAYQSTIDDTKKNRFMSNLGLDVRLAKGLTWKPSISYDVIDSDQTKFTDGYQTNYGRQKKGIGDRTNVVDRNYNFENTLNYNFKKDKHDFSALGGVAIQEINYTRDRFYGEEFPDGTTQFNFSLAKTNANQELLKETTKYTSFFGRAVYTLSNKYTVMGVFRANGASPLAKGNKWSYLPGVSASWIVSNENFLQNVSAISELKLRGGWGQTANISGIPAYSYYDLQRETYLDSGIFNPTQTKNPDLTWETTTDTNFGVDFGFINNRIKFSADFYKRDTKDLLLQIRFPGMNLPYKYNGGSMENKGMEFALNTKNFQTENFTWNTNFNISFNKNKVTSINYQQFLDTATFETVGESGVRNQVGQPLGSFFGYVVDRVNPANGELLYKDLNGNGYFDTGDRTTIGDPTPKYTFGFSNNFKYKNLYLDVLVTGSQGNDVLNASRLDLELMSDFKNQSTVVLDRWTTAGQITNVPKAGASSAQHISDRFVEDGSYIKLKAVTLGYDFKKPFKGMSNLNVYVTGQNLVTWTNYTGFDPEVNYTTTQGVLGVDYGTYPQVRTFIIGLKANF